MTYLFFSFSSDCQFRSLPLKDIKSTPYYRTDLFKRNVEEVRMYCQLYL